MADNYPGSPAQTTGADHPGTGSVLVTPNDGADLAFTGRSLYCATAGTVKFTCRDGTIDTWTVPAGFVIPLRIARVWATGTTVTELHSIL